MKKPAIVRIKGAGWEAFAGKDSSELQSTNVTTSTKKLPEASSPGANNPKAILLDLTVRHFSGLRLTTTEAKRLSSALRRCIKGEAVDVGPVGLAGRTYNFRRTANAIAIRVGQGCIRLPLDAAKALIQPLQGAVSPGIFAKVG